MSLNNSELFVAIDTAYNMLKNANKYQDEYKMFLTHLELLLKEQQKRAKECK